MAIDANSYFQANPDVAQAYTQETYGLSPQDFAEAHWLMYGQNEQRAAPETIDPYFNANPDVAKSYAENRYDMTPDDFAQAHYLIYGGDEQRSAPEALNPYFVENPDVAAAYKENRYDLSPTDFANTHFQLYGGDEQRAAPPTYQTNYISPIKNPSKVPTPKLPNTPIGGGMSAGDTSSLGGGRFSFADAAPQGPLQNLGTFGASGNERLGAGNANYQSDLIRSLRQADNGLANNNAGVTKYGYASSGAAGAAPNFNLNSGGALNPTAFVGQAASPEDVQNWNAYSSYKIDALKSQQPMMSYQDWLVAQSAPKAEPTAPPMPPYYDGIVGGGN